MTLGKGVKVMQMTKWYAVRTAPNREASVTRKLKREGLTTFYPRNRIRGIRRNGKVRWREVAHFPCYTFCQAEFHQLSIARKADGQVVMFAGKPTAIPEQVMQILMAGTDAEGLIKMTPHHHARCRFAKMQQVRFKEGPLANTMAEVILDDGKDLIHLMNALGRITAPADNLVAA